MKTRNFNSKIFVNALLRSDLKSFIIKSFQTINPGVQYLDNWHIDIIVDYLNALSSGQFSRLIINIPPRYLKSLCVNVAWSAWLLGINPANRIISASYSERIGTIHSLNTRYIMLSNWYHGIFPDAILLKDQNEKSNFRTTSHGFRITTSVFGSITGEGGDYLILDDPINPAHCHNTGVLKNTVDWFERVFMTRINNRKKGVVVLIMQRLDQNDLSGVLLKKCGWESLSLPLVSKKDCSIAIDSKIYKRKAGELLHESYQDAEVVHKLRQEVGSYNFAAQYQQDPIMNYDGLFKKFWIKYYKVIDCPMGRVVLSWDTASGVNNKGDFSVCSVWIESNSCFYLLDVYRERLDYPSIKSRVLFLAKKWSAVTVLIENKSSGMQLIQELKNDINIVPITPVGGKMDRFRKCLAIFEMGQVLLPENVDWAECLLDELLSFPCGTHDDQIDSITQYLIWSKSKIHLHMCFL
ncbi:conserved hypothetical protein [Candidatus Xenohaliotis californiensis]|uniref:Terminase large subunit gp17-like C-terminal domain-containing protein n=1 Tax=Candidatus Xenohaliotis californiensis TaxID=84677 RepID=A0ABP0ERS3_9RICK|nr:conserved hypothetical protein [Candidatus Xenohaliotis californiensis]